GRGVAVGGVPRKRVGPRPHAASPSEPRQAGPQILGEHRERFLGVAVATKPRAEEAHDLVGVRFDRARGGGVVVLCVPRTANGLLRIFCWRFAHGEPSGGASESTGLPEAYEVRRFSTRSEPTA